MDNGKSDSANLDAVVELLIQSSKSPAEALMIMVPEAYGSQPALNSRPEVKDNIHVYTLYQYFVCTICTNGLRSPPSLASGGLPAVWGS